jgi:hypothetical protein
MAGPVAGNGREAELTEIRLASGLHIVLAQCSGRQRGRLFKDSR